jgi:hypothetical protein
MGTAQTQAPATSSKRLRLDANNATPPPNAYISSTPLRAFFESTSLTDANNTTPPPNAYPLSTPPTEANNSTTPPHDYNKPTSPPDSTISCNRPTPRPTDFTKIPATPDGRTDYTRLSHMVETLQMVLRKFDGDPVDSDWSYQIVCGSHGVEQMALRNFIQGGPTWIALKGHVEFLVRALILNCTPAYHLNTTAVTLLNQNLVALLSSTREPQSVFLKVQAQLIELAGPQLPNTLAPQVYRARVAIDQQCFRYQQGRCRYPADVCDRQHVGAPPPPPYFGSAHTPSGGRRPTNVPKYGTLTVVPCRDFTRGKCQRGTACRFAHNNGPQAFTYEIGDDSQLPNL